MRGDVGFREFVELCDMRLASCFVLAPQPHQESTIDIFVFKPFGDELRAYMIGYDWQGGWLPPSCILKVSNLGLGMKYMRMLPA